MARRTSTEEAAPASLSDTLTRLLEATNSASTEKLTYLEGTTGRWPDSDIIRTGSIDLDLAIGVGGWPRGRVVEIAGEFSSGKTTLCLHTVREAQKAGVAVVYIDAENALDPNYMRKLGVDLDAILINQPESLQSAIDLMNFLMRESVDMLPNGLLIVVDSIPALAPNEVLEASAEQQTRALAPRYWSAQLPGLAKNAAQTKTTILLINQERDAMNSGPYGPSKTTPGGNAIKFFTSVRLSIRRKDVDKRDFAGQTCLVKTVKNKVSAPFKEAEFWLPAGEPIDWAQDVITNAMWRDLILEDHKFEDGEVIKKKGWFTYVLEEGDIDLMRQDELEAWLNEEPPTDENGEVEEDYEVHTEDNFEFSYSEDAEAITVYRMGPFTEEMRNYPSLLRAIEERLLDRLNGDPSVQRAAERHEGDED